jgi:hypothetical protein
MRQLVTGSSGASAGRADRATGLDLRPVAVLNVPARLDHPRRLGSLALARGAPRARRGLWERITRVGLEAGWRRLTLLSVEPIMAPHRS